MSDTEVTAFLLTHSDELELDSDNEILIAAILCASHKPQYSLDYKKYKRFDMDAYSDTEFMQQFRFEKKDILKLATLLGLDSTLVYSNRVTCDPQEALCMVLRCLAYPNQLCDLIRFFGYSECEISTIVNETIAFLAQKHHGHMNDCFTTWLNHEEMANVISRKGCPMRNVWAFIDGTLMQICYPKYHQEVLFSGHKRYHGVKYQTVMAPNRMIVHVYSPYPRRRHDLGLLEDSNLLDQLYQIFDGQGNPMLVFGDKAYHHLEHIVAPFMGAALSPQ